MKRYRAVLCIDTLAALFNSPMSLSGPLYLYAARIRAGFGRPIESTPRSSAILLPARSLHLGEGPDLQRNVEIEGAPAIEGIAGHQQERVVEFLLHGDRHERTVS